MGGGCMGADHHLRNEREVRGAASASITKLQMGAALTNHIEAQSPKDVRHLGRLEDGG